jgi:hypothetical protein
LSTGKTPLAAKMPSASPTVSMPKPCGRYESGAATAAIRKMTSAPTRLPTLSRKRPVKNTNGKDTTAAMVSESETCF